MTDTPTRLRDDDRAISRRHVLTGSGAFLLTVGAVSSFGSGAFSSTRANRTTNVSVAEDPNAILGLAINDPVTKNTRERLVDLTNNTTSAIEVTVSLDDCSHGTLYNSVDTSGCTVTTPTTIAADGTDYVDIEAAVKDMTIPFTVTATSPDVTIKAHRATTAVAGNSPTAVLINKVQGFSANSGQNDWSIDQVQVQDGDNDDDISSVTYEVAESDGTTVATRTDSGNYGKKYQARNVTIEPDDPTYIVLPGTEYTLTVTGEDADGNTDSATRTTTA